MTSLYNLIYLFIITFHEYSFNIFSLLFCPSFSYSLLLIISLTLWSCAEKEEPKTIVKEEKREQKKVRKQVEKINFDDVDKNVKVKGFVKDLFENEKVMLITIEQPQDITVVLFKSKEDETTKELIKRLKKKIRKSRSRK